MKALHTRAMGNGKKVRDGEEMLNYKPGSR